MEEEFREFDKRNAWNTVYQEIRNASTYFDCTFKDARKTENKNLNRYRDVNPFDHSRVRLKRGDKDYINASLVRVPSANRSYILTQGPLASTTGHFWLMIWEQESKAILMLNRVIEKNAIKCHQYWPLGEANDGEDEYVLHDVGLVVTYVSEEEAPNYTIRKFLLTDFQSGKSRTVLQFHYTTWPDFGVPASPAAFLNFLFAVRESGALSDNVGPAVVHCSAGIGRSGTFCLADSCLVLIEKNGDSKSINIRDMLLEMRRYRMGLIQTPDQLRFSYMAIIEGSKKILKNVDNELVPSDTKAEDLGNSIVRDKSAKPKASEESDSQSNSSDEGIANSNTCDSTFSTPPPLPPRPVRNYDTSPTSCNSISDSSLLPDDSPEYSPGKAISVNSVRKQSQNDLSEFPISENCDYSPDSVENKGVNQKNDLQNSGSFKSSPSQSRMCSELESTAEARTRKRKERSEKTAAIVQKIKKKQKETELWQKRRSLLKRISFGIVVLLGTGVLVYRYYSKA